MSIGEQADDNCERPASREGTEPQVGSLRWLRSRFARSARSRSDHPRLPFSAEPPSDWVRPWWAEHQGDPHSTVCSAAPSQVRYWNRDVPVEALLLANTLRRSWTTVGLPETPDRAEVDPRGLVVFGRWSLDWWVRAGEEWVFPSRASSVRQRLVDGMPAVETVLRVGGGEVVHRVSAARGAAVGLDDAERHVTKRASQVPQDDISAVPEVFVVEIANRTPAPVAIALAVRPYHLGAFEHSDGEIWGPSTMWGIDAISVDGPVMTIDDGFLHELGHAVVIIDRAPSDVVVGSHGSDCAAALVQFNANASAASERGVPVSIGTSSPSASAATTPQPQPPSISQTERMPKTERDLVSVACPQRLANVAAVFPLVAGATLRATVVGRGSAFDGNLPANSALSAAVLNAVPSLDRVANGWRHRVDAGCRLELPSGRLTDAALAARAAQLLATAPFDDGSGVVGPMLVSALSAGSQFAGDDLVQLLALIESGSPEQVRDLLLRQAQVQLPSGETSSMGVSVTGTSLVLAEHLLSLYPDPAFAEAIGEFAASAARWLLSRNAAQREMPWAVREGLRAGYRLLLRNGAARSASALWREAMSLPEALRVDVAAPVGARYRRHPSSAHTPIDTARASASQSFYRDGWARLPWEASGDGALATPSQRWEWLSHDTGLWIHAAVPWSPPLPFVAAELVDGTPADFVSDTAASCGHDIVATALLALAEARVAPQRAFERVEALVSVSSATLNWPTFMHPQLRTGTNGTGHDLVVGGLFVRTLLRLVVDVPDDGTLAKAQPPTLRLAAHWPMAWLGQPVEVHGVPTRIGSVSWALRWHGERPALLWEVVPHDSSSNPPVVTAPGLDPAFGAMGWHGEALLASPSAL